MFLCCPSIRLHSEAWLMMPEIPAQRTADEFIFSSFLCLVPPPFFSKSSSSGKSQSQLMCLCFTSLGPLEWKESQSPLNSSIITHICHFNIAVLVADISVELSFIYHISNASLWRDAATVSEKWQHLYEFMKLLKLG